MPQKVRILSGRKEKDVLKFNWFVLKKQVGRYISWQEF